LWGLRADEVKGQNFLNLDIGLPVERLRPAIKACIAGDSTFSETITDATNRRGRPLSCKVTVSPLMGTGKDVRGAILLMEEQNAVAGG
jgi:two-component system CheB/CheR fusion protein